VKFFFVTALRDISITTDLGRGDMLDSSTFVTNNVKIISRQLTTEFERAAGKLEVDFIRNAPALVYATDERPDGTDPQKYLHEKLFQVSGLLNCIWLVKDNAISPEIMFCVYTQGLALSVDSTTHGIFYSLADGSRSTTILTRDELREARRLAREQIKLTQFVGRDYPPVASGSGRLQQAFYFAQGARSTFDIGLKVTNYCSALEALFASGTTELTHQLAERTAVFLEELPTERYEVYSTIKKAYGLRSLVIHGAVSDASRQRRFSEASFYLDNIVRRIFRKVFQEPIPRALVEQKKFDEAFLLRIFGAKWEDLVAND
jgi:hypothetical protein